MDDDGDVTAGGQMYIQYVIISPFLHVPFHALYSTSQFQLCCGNYTVGQEPLPRGSMTLYQVAAKQVSPTPGTRGDATVFVLTFGEQVDDTMVDGGSGCRQIEMEMWSCLRFTVGMTGVSSPHLPVAATEIRKPSDVLCYTLLNGSCN